MTFNNISITLFIFLCFIFNFSLYACNEQQEQQQHTFLLRSSQTKEDIEKLLTSAHVTILKHNNESKSTRKLAKDAKKTAKKTAKAYKTAPIPPPQPTTSISSIRQTDPTPLPKALSVKRKLTKIIEIPMNITQTEIETLLNDTLLDWEDEEEDEEYPRPLDEFIQIKTKLTSLLMKNDYEINEEAFSYTYTILAFLVVTVLAVFALEFLFGKNTLPQKNGEYLLGDENEFDLHIK